MAKCHAAPMALLPVIAVIFFALVAATESRRREAINSGHGAVATDDGRCSRIGRDVLREGGHAVDAAVAATLCLGVVSPASSGIGGGAFMLVRLASGEAWAFDMRETAPLRASKDMYAGNETLKARGPLSIAVPGELAGLHKAWKQYGKLPWRRLVEPAARLARRGFRISRYLYMQMYKTKSGIFADEGLHDTFTSNRNLLHPGDICYNVRLAHTLEAISRHGPKALYDGLVGIDLVRDVQRSGGKLTLEDLQKYRVKVRKPISTDIMGLEILGMPPPSAGGAGMVLNPGQLRVHSGGIAWRKEGGIKVVEVDKADIAGVTWMKVPPGYQLGVRIKDGLCYKFIGFRE